MSKVKINKRYTFRVTEKDEDIYNFIESSKQTSSETIRQLLKFALAQIKKEKEKQKIIQQHEQILNELKQLREQQNQGFQEIMNKLNSGLIVASHEVENNEEKELVEKSMENSIDSMLSSFGLD